jgi:hypothetical protein
MITKIHIPTTPFATAFGMPIDDAIERLNATARELTAGAEKTPSQDFGLRLADAVRRKQSPRFSATTVFAASAVRKEEDENDDDEKKDDDQSDSFGTRLKRAIERKSRASKTQKQHQRIAERERKRYPATASGTQKRLTT